MLPIHFKSHTLPAVPQTAPQAVPSGDPHQRAALGSVVRFFAVLVVLTLVARGTAGATMPLVTTTRPGNGRVSTSFTGTGTVAKDAGAPFTLPADLLVTRVDVKAGETIHAGDVIAAFDGTEVAQTIAAKQAALAKMEVQAAQLAKGKQADPFAANQAQEGLQRSYASFHKADDAGQQGIQDAKDARDSAQSALDDLRAHPPASPELVATPEQATAESARSAWQAKLAAAEAAVKQADAAVTAAGQAAESSLDGALAGAQAAEDSRNSALHSYQKEAAQTADSNTLDRADANVTRAAIETAKTELAALNALQSAHYQYLSPADGTLTTLALEPGKASTAVGGLIAGADAGSTLTATLTEDQAKLVTVGTALRVSQGSGAEQSATVNTLAAPGDDGSVQLTAALPAGSWKAGAASLSITAQGAEQSLTLPGTAVNQDAEGKFVYIVEEQNTVLGIQNVLVRIPVTVLESGDTTAAVSGALSADSVVVSGSNKPLSTGAKVRLDG